MKQVTGSNPSLDTNSSEISIQIHLDGFSVLSPSQGGVFVQKFDSLDLDTFLGAIASRAVSSVQFSSTSLALVPIELFDSASPLEHLLSSGLALENVVCYVQEIPEHSLVVVWAVDRVVSDVLESLFDPSVAFVHSIANTLQIEPKAFAPVIVIDFSSAGELFLLHYNMGRLQNYLALSNFVSTDVLYYSRNFELSQRDLDLNQPMQFVLCGNVRFELVQLLRNYYSQENVRVIE